MKVSPINPENNQNFTAIKKDLINLNSHSAKVLITKIFRKANTLKTDVFELLKHDKGDHYYLTGKILQDPK